MNWLKQEFDRARKRSAQIPPFAQPTYVGKKVINITNDPDPDSVTKLYVESQQAPGAVPCPICNEFAATLDMTAPQLTGDVAFIHRRCLREMAARIEVLDREFAGWETTP